MEKHNNDNRDHLEMVPREVYMGLIRAIHPRRYIRNSIWELMLFTIETPLYVSPGQWSWKKNLFQPSKSDQHYMS